MTTERDLIQRLTERLDHLHSNYDLPSQSALIAEALDYLDQPEPEGPTNEELLAIAAASIDPYQDSGIAIGEYDYEQVYGSELIAFARAILARWGRPTTTPTETP